MDPCDETETTASEPPPAPDSAFAGRLALVTGAGSGLGAAAARALAGCGARVIVADADGERARSVASEIDGQPIALDVSDPPSWDALTLEEPPTLAFLTSGICGLKDAPYEIHQATRAEVTRALGTNFLGVLHALRRLTPAMIAAGGARICVHAGVYGIEPNEADPLCAATKHAVVGLARSVAPVLGAEGVTLTILCAGALDVPALAGTARNVAMARFGGLLPVEDAAQVGLDLFEYGTPGEIREITPRGRHRVRMELVREAIEPDRRHPH